MDESKNFDQKSLTSANHLSAEHERLGLAVTKIISDYARELDGLPVTSDATPAELEKIFDEPLPRSGISADEILARFESDVAPHAMQIPSPRYYGLFNPTPLPIAVWADALASAINQNEAAWRNSPSASIIEARVLRWLCELVGYGGESFGTLTSGGSEANLIGLKCARDKAHAEMRDKGVRAASGELVVYASEQSHYSLEKSVDILGLGRKSLRKVEVDERFHIRTDLLRQAIESDKEKGKIPCCIAGAAGATSTGIVDPLSDLADIAREYGCWFHVDAAYGGALALSEKHKALLQGIARADSITIDPHKWMFVPFACGAVLVREGGRILRDAFDITPEYLSEERGGADVEYDFFRYGQLGTRRFNALKIWMSLKFMGTRGYAEIIERQIELTHYLAARLDELEEFERVGEVETAVCCFRFLPEEIRKQDEKARDAVQRNLQQRVERSRQAWVSTTILKGRRAIRVNVNSFLTERRHIDDLVELLLRESAGLLKEGEVK
ncbi:MAG: aromatic-L-amino-acid/L-tryptophan decarboxylase [Acidobacteriota bacterium]|jgi:aromatic-L-amino-acid decarboxylase|nr:aromatic-L-amino-acid/L-tryptophan decarboxylase [Acidobacteriota bacterium]